MRTSYRLTALATAALAALLAGCVAPSHTVVHAEASYRVPPVWTPPPPEPVISVQVEPPLVQPAPILVDVAPPPMLVEVPPPQPYPGAVWTGGYWGWQGRWVWCAGRWASPPRTDDVWVQPYYEHRDGAVVFVAGFWAARGVAFVPPPPGLHLSIQVAIGGGTRPVGPMGVFVPPPPGSRPGLIVPAPIGTPPAVVVSAPPVTNIGMRIQNNTTQINHTVINNTVNNTTNVNNVRNVTNITNVTIVAPPGSTADGKAFHSDVPAAAHLAAAMPTFGHVRAATPPPVSAPLPPNVNAGRPAAFGGAPQAAMPTSMPPGHAVPAPAATGLPPSTRPTSDPAVLQHERDLQQQERQQQEHQQQEHQQQERLQQEHLQQERQQQERLQQERQLQERQQQERLQQERQQQERQQQWGQQQAHQQQEQQRERQLQEQRQQQQQRQQWERAPSREQGREDARDGYAAAHRPPASAPPAREAGRPDDHRRDARDADRAHARGQDRSREQDREKEKEKEKDRDR